MVNLEGVPVKPLSPDKGGAGTGASATATGTQQDVAAEAMNRIMRGSNVGQQIEVEAQDVKTAIDANNTVKTGS